MTVDGEHPWWRDRFASLAISMFALVGVTGFFQDWTGRIIVAVLFTLVLLSAIAAEHRRLRGGIAVLVVPALLALWSGLAFDAREVLMLGRALIAVVLGVVFGSTLRAVLGAQRVTRDTLFGSVAAYLLLGLIFAQVFTLIELASPGAFRIPDALSGYVLGEELTYYSLVTITTLGYGDIMPVAPLARNLAAIEAMVGQLYVAILVARLVGIQIAHGSD